MPADDIARLYDFTSGTIADPEQVDGELNQIVQIVNTKASRDIANTFVGNNIFNGNNTFNGDDAFTGDPTFSGDVTFSGSAAVTGILNLGISADPGTPAEGDTWYNTTDHKLRFRNNSGTINVPSAFDDLSDVTITTPASGQTVTYNGSAWVNSAGPILTKAFTSSDQTITSAGTLALAHGLAAVPELVQLRLKCTSSDQGFSPDEIVLVNNAAGASSNASGVTIWLDSTNVNLRFNQAANVFAIFHASTGVVQNLTNNKWVLIVKAWA